MSPFRGGERHRPAIRPESREPWLVRTLNTSQLVRVMPMNLTRPFGRQH